MFELVIFTKNRNKQATACWILSCGNLHSVLGTLNIFLIYVATTFYSAGSNKNIVMKPRSFYHRIATTLHVLNIIASKNHLKVTTTMYVADFVDTIVEIEILYWSMELPPSFVTNYFSYLCAETILLLHHINELLDFAWRCILDGIVKKICIHRTFKVLILEIQLLQNNNIAKAYYLHLRT